MVPAWKDGKEGVHAKSYQEGSAHYAQVGKGLQNRAKRLPSKDGKFTHNLDCGQGLRTGTSQGKGNKEKGIRVGKRTRRLDVLPTWQPFGPLALRSTRLRIMAIRRAERASE